MTAQDADPPIEERVADALREAEASLAVAESCTGGLLTSLLTDGPGASDYLDRGLVTYANDAKQELLAVARETLDEHGAVSAPTARQMARGVRDTAGTTWGVSTTGIAGPAGGTADKPVGTVFIGTAYAAPWGTTRSTVHVEEYHFDGGRLARKERFARQALRDLATRIDQRN